jgi:hypothetical protein
MQYGNALERLASAEVQSSPQYSSLLAHVGGSRQPDFIGRGPAAGVNFDITTPAQVGAHLARPGYGSGLNVITYQRPAGFGVFP